MYHNTTDYYHNRATQLWVQCSIRFQPQSKNNNSKRNEVNICVLLSSCTASILRLIELLSQSYMYYDLGSFACSTDSKHECRLLYGVRQLCIYMYTLDGFGMNTLDLSEQLSYGTKNNIALRLHVIH